MIPVAEELFDDSFWDKGRPYLSRMGASVQAVLALGGNSLLDLGRTPGPKSNALVASIALLRHTLCLGDAAALLIERGVGGPTIPLARAMMESLFGGLYLLREDTDRRANQFIVADRLHELRWLELATPGTRQHKLYRESVKGDPCHLPPRVATATKQQITERRKQIEQLCQRPDIAKIADEWRSLNPNRPKFPWYALFGGPRTIQSLACNLGQRVRYEILYRLWSNYAHGEAAMRGLSVKDGMAAIQPLRAPYQIADTYTMIIEMILHHSRAVVKALGDDHQWATLRDGYIAHCRHEYRYLQRINFTVPHHQVNEPADDSAPSRCNEPEQHDDERQEGD